MTARYPDDVLDRFWAKVDRPDPRGCWLWTAGTNNWGYGKFKVDGADALPHRFVYELLVGPIPDGFQIDHLCRVPACCNPSHLEAVTPRENIHRSLRARGVTPRAPRRRREPQSPRTHCTKGHELTPENVYVHPTKGNRECRVCRSEGQRRHTERRRMQRQAAQVARAEVASPASSFATGARPSGVVSLHAAPVALTFGRSAGPQPDAGATRTPAVVRSDPWPAASSARVAAQKAARST